MTVGMQVPGKKRDLSEGPVLEHRTALLEGTRSMSDNESQCLDLGGDHPWRDENILRSLYVEQGLTTIEVSDRLGCNRETVAKWLKKTGIGTRDSGKPPVEELTDKARVKEMYVEKRMSAPEIADHLGCGKSSVHRALDRHGIETRDVGKDNITEERLLDAEYLRQEYRDVEKTAPEIATDLSCSATAVRNALRREGIERRGSSLCTPDELRDADEMRRLYHDEQLPASDIAERFGCSSKVVYDWLARHGIERRDSHAAGEQSHKWRGGYESGFGYNWIKQRKAAINRDGNCCQRCGMSGEQHRTETGNGLNVHHIRPRRKFVDEDGELDYESANRLDNLITLCTSCYMALEGLPIGAGEDN